MKLRIPRPQFALRDFFWCVLLAASLAAWGSSHVQLAREIDRMTKENVWSVQLPEHHEPSRGELDRLTFVRSLRGLTDAALLEQLDAHMADEPGKFSSRVEACFWELGRRGQPHNADAIRDRFAPYCLHNIKLGWMGQSRNLEFITTVRRSQGERDPLVIDVKLAGPSAAKSFTSIEAKQLEKASGPTTIIGARLGNVDSGNNEITYTTGGDYRGGRRERWHVRITDRNGNVVPRSNYGSFNGGGIISWETLKPGERGDYAFFDLRRYVAQPRSGKYQLQISYHDFHSIADLQSLDGLIVSQSSLIPVTVVNTRHNDRPPSGLGPVAAILGLCGALTAVAWAFPRRLAKDATAQSPPASRLQRVVQRLATRDACWIALVAIVALAYAFDHTRQRAYLGRLAPDAAAEWTLTFDERP